jgi:integrase
MSANKFGKSWWTDFRWSGKRYRYRSPENSRVGALKYETTLRSKLANGEVIDGKEKTQCAAFRDFAAGWLETYVRTNNKPSEFARKRSVLRLGLVPFFGSMSLDEITEAKVEQYKASCLRDGLTAKSVNNHLTVLSSCLKTAADWGDMESGKLPRIRPLKALPPSFAYLTFEESERLLSAIDDRTYYGMTLAALRTGMRMGELLALDWADVNLERGIITVRRAMSAGVLTDTKSHRERHIPINPDLRDWLAGETKQRGSVFRHADGSAVIYGRAKRSLMRYSKAAGVAFVGWHGLRHSFASQLTMKSAPARAVQAFLGHSDLRTTMRYSHLAPSVMAETINLLASPEIRKFGQQVPNGAIAAPTVEADGLELLRSTKRKSQTVV